MRPGEQSGAQGRRPREDWALQCTGCHSFIGPDAAGLAQGRLGKGLRESGVLLTEQLPRAQHPAGSSHRHFYTEPLQSP